MKKCDGRKAVNNFHCWGDRLGCLVAKDLCKASGKANHTAASM